VVSRVQCPWWRFSCGRALQPGLLVPVVERTFPLLLVSVVLRVLPRALLCAACAALCNTGNVNAPARRAELSHTIRMESRRRGAKMAPQSSPV
jgi:hypothetical protein